MQITAVGREKTVTLWEMLWLTRPTGLVDLSEHNHHLVLLTSSTTQNNPLCKLTVPCFCYTPIMLKSTNIKSMNPLRASLVEMKTSKMKMKRFTSIQNVCWARQVELAAVKENIMVLFTNAGLWSWPPWVVCAPAFNHKLKKLCISQGFS